MSKDTKFIVVKDINVENEAKHQKQLHKQNGGLLPIVCSLRDLGEIHKKSIFDFDVMIDEAYYDELMEAKNAEGNGKMGNSSRANRRAYKATVKKQLKKLIKKGANGPKE